MMIIMMIKMVECLYLPTPHLKFELSLNFKNKVWNDLSKLINNIDTTLISLITLSFLIISALSWLVLRTLKEGRKALTEIDKDR